MVTRAEAAAPVGAGFTVTPSDLAFILKQIKIAEYHAANTTPATGPCAAMVGPSPNQISSPLLSLGLRTVDGSCNNLIAGQEFFAASHQLFPRLTTPVFRAAENSPPAFGPPRPTSYAQTKGLVFDSEPRVISNLIVDQTATNPAAIAVAGFPRRTQGNEGVFPCTDESADPPLPLGCTPSGETLFIPNVTTDVGLSPPFNSLFTIFGQFFDHGIDKRKDSSKSGTVFVPLKDDDPLVAGPDHIFGNADDLDPNLRFMVLGRSANQPGPDGILGDDRSTTTVDESADDIHEAKNIDTPLVDQSQTYTSDPSHQVFLRQYANNIDDKPVSTGKLISRPDGGQANWAQVKQQAASLLGLQLVDMDALNIPMLAVDPYGNFIPGPNGYPQYVTDTGMVEGDPLNPVPVPANAKRIGIAFLDDIAHSAVPNPTVGPDADTTAGGSLDTTVPAGSYDDELLDMHVLAGDGRVNENIALTAIHQIFHSEHDRLVGDIKNVLLDDTSPKGVAALAEWKLVTGADGWNGERLFQAARFINEMEYQHLVFEEFARKIQPLINPFEPFAFTQADINPAVKAEFAHAVYRFGHSMLTETVSRTNADGSNNDILLLDGFLNPGEYYNGGPAGPLTSDEAAGSIFMGMSDQTGSEIDEFVTETLRNNLLGLPLDLPTINMARARAEGIPSLNELRRELYASTNDSQLIPYTSWVDFGLNLRNPESLINFVAAYGRHPTILNTPGPDGILLDDPTTDGVDESADNGPPTLASRREAARVIVDPQPTDIPPADAAAFMNSSGSWANQETGLNNIDLWVGGLAERTNIFGGHLGSTFNYVFENQLTDLQNSDRLYYLGRTPGMNLRAQLEGNSFAELVMRNTNAHTLKADAFATADCKFQLSNLHGTAADFATLGNQVADDLASECDEQALLIRLADGTIRYRTTNSVDPPGINGQSVFNGTNFADRIWGGVDNDTFLGNEGNDIIEGNDGADVVLGGDGNDKMTDSAGDDVFKGGPGNDAMESGSGLDLILGGDGNDFSNGGANINETFGGTGNDFMILGTGTDAGFGDSGDDWEEGGDQPDLMIGDSSSLFFTDPNEPGHDVVIGQAGDDDYDTEGGDDILVTGPGVEKNAGAAGYDFSTGYLDPQPQDADLARAILPPDILVAEVRDRFHEVEALSGGSFDDKLRGDSVVPVQVGGLGFIGCDALDQAGLDRIAGLDALVPPLNTPTADVVANSSSINCALTGPFVWGVGNILLGGAGSDLIEGRGADDIIDGDSYLNARLSIRDHNDASIEIGSTDLLGHKYLRDGTGALVGQTLQQAIMAGTVDPGDVMIVREILSTPNAADVDTALFSDVLANYDITTNADGSVKVNHARGAATDGIDTLWNIEQMTFADQPLVVNSPPVGTVQISNTSPIQGQLLTATQAFTDGDGINAGTLVFRWQAETAPGVWLPVGIGATFTPNAATVGLRLRVVATYTDGEGEAENVTSDPTAAVANVNDPPVGAPALSNTAPQQGQALTASTAGISDADGLVGVTFTFQWQESLGGAAFTNIPGATAATFTPTAAQAGRTLRVVVSFTDNQGTAEQLASAGSAIVIGALPGLTVPVSPPSGAAFVDRSDAPVIGAARRGGRGAPVTAIVRWTRPAHNGGSAITGYRVKALRMSSAADNATVIGRKRSHIVAAGARRLEMTLPKATWRFRVVAINAVGTSANSARSNAVVPR
ncbi:MAG TPA: peroxidase family protein [Candidatus Dormibacteraeota bacterium]|nr:peroxidase family protein [Candidatus Dormibacteraeota bacterium]